MRTFNTFLLGVAVIFLTACGGGGGGGGSSSEEPTQGDILTPSAATANHSVYMPKEIDIKILNGDIDGIFTSSGAGGIQASISSGYTSIRAADGSMSRPTSNSVRDVAGFIAQRPALNAESTASEVLDGFETLIRSDTNVISSTSTGRQAFPAPGQGAAISSYSVTLSNATQPTDFANMLAQYIGVNVQNGMITNLPVAIESEPFETEYTLVIGIIYFNQNDIVVSVAVVPRNLAGTYAHITNHISSAKNVGNTGASTAQKTNSFTAQAGSGLADFLFVIDNSGSMGQEQAAVSSAASIFGNSIVNSGLDYRIGIIATDSDTLRDGYADGGFTSDITEFSSDAIVGTSGSGTETGIWFSEQSLLSVNMGDSSDGTVIAEGYPRSGASLSVIILSDERSQYTRRSGGATFDVTNNLFLDRGYRVYAMIEPSDTNSQYGPLALATGGSVADIGDTAVFSTIMNNIAVDAGGASSQFILSETPIVSTVNVTVNGTAILNSAVDGWSYNAASNSVVFHGNSLLNGGEAVSISYSYFSSTGTNTSGCTNTGGGTTGDQGTDVNPVAVCVGMPFAGSISSYGESYYSFSANATGIHTIGLTNVSSSDMDLDWEIFTGAATYVSDCGNDIANGDEICTVYLTAGTDYILVVDEWDATTGGTFTLSVTAP